MRFFKAVSVAQKPYIQWNKVADSIDELAELGMFEDPLVVGEDYIPPYLFGVSTVKIVSGELVERTSEEMSDFSDEYNVAMALLNQANQSDALKTDFFTYDSRKFPMNETARLYYQAIQNLAAADANVLDMYGNIYALASGNIPAFLTAYYTRLKSITQPEA